MNCPLCNNTRFVNCRSSHQVIYPIPCECVDASLEKSEFRKIAAELFSLVKENPIAWQYHYELTDAYERLEAKFLTAMKQLNNHLKEVA